jgi:exopolyphosphatase/guanosine-5'-triphosphate,3'-diphosphate pyrophosphatase
MQMTGYPLQIVDQYDISAADAQAAARLIARQSKSSLERVEGVSRKRAETLPYAAVVMEALLERLKIKRVTTSAYGLREGLIFDATPKRLMRLDPLVQGCASLGGRLATTRRLGPALEAWLKPFWTQLKPGLPPDRARVVLAAACRLADLGSRLHPDHRADLVFDQVLRAPVAGQDHAERVFLAVAAFARHTAQPPPPETEAYRRILGAEGQRIARALGLAVRLGCDLSGRAPRLLSASRLRLDQGVLVLTAEPKRADLMLGEQTARRLAALAGVLGVEFKILAD